MWFRGWTTTPTIADGRVSQPPSSQAALAESVVTSMARVVDDPAASAAFEEEEDDVNELLTQFPVYGSGLLSIANRPPQPPQQHASSSSNTATTPTNVTSAPPPDWLGVVPGNPGPNNYSSPNLSSPSPANPPKPPSKDDWDEREQRLWKPNGEQQHGSNNEDPPNGNEMLRPRRYFATEPPADTTTITSTSEEKESVFWMPDKLCTKCLACEAPFTVLRRRHHCRLCGHVFCNACSAFSYPQPLQEMDGMAEVEKKNKDSPTVRACRACFQAQEMERQKQQEAAAAASAQAQVARVTRVTRPCVSVSAGPMGVEVSSLPGVASDNDNDDNNDSDDQRWQDPESMAGSRPSGAHPTARQDHAPRPLHQSMRHTKSSTTSKNTTATTASAKASLEPSWNMPLSKQGGRSGNVVAADSSLCKDPQVREGYRHLGLQAAAHLENMTSTLLQQHAPLLLQELASPSAASATTYTQARHVWTQKLLELATRACYTVDPQVKQGGDLLDIRPYCKIKVIGGGSVTRDCAYLSGVVFRKTVTHKRMARTLESPRLLLLAGGIEFTKHGHPYAANHSSSSSRSSAIAGARSNPQGSFASLETLFEQEDVSMEMLVAKLLKHAPDIVLVGKSVSRKAQELLADANVVLMQHVKPQLLRRIARQTGATVVSAAATEYHSYHPASGLATTNATNFGPHVLGKCRRFRLVTVRDDELWTDQRIDTPVAPAKKRLAMEDEDEKDPFVPQQPQDKCSSIPVLLEDPDLANHKRQAALAAAQLGDGVMDGAVAVRSGLAKRGVVQTYVLLEGCPKHLGCTIVLRGASRAALKQVKTVLKFLVNVAYNLRLETAYLRERGARLPLQVQVVKPAHTFSSSLCVDYGQAPGGRPVRPWNGGSTESNNTSTNNSNHSNNQGKLESDVVTAMDHQSILITSVWMTEKSQCCPAEVKGICYYSMQDVALGQFLRDSCFNLSLKCQNPNCKKTVLDHSLSFVHNDGLINIVVQEMDDALPPSPLEGQKSSSASNSNTNNNGNMKNGAPKEVGSEEEEVDRPIATWTYCKHCQKVVTPIVYISEMTWKFSFGKFLEVFFYNRDAILNAPDRQCSCSLQSSSILYFGCGNLSARFTYEKVAPYGVFVRKTLPIDASFHRREAMRRLELISMGSAALFVNFDKHMEKVSREARSLFNTPVIRPEYLQTVLSDLNSIGSEIDHASKALQEKIASVSYGGKDGTVTEAMLCFPWLARRYLHMLTSAWNEKLAAAGQALSAMKKLAASLSHRSDGVIGANVVNDPLHDELLEGLKRLRQLNEQYSRVNITDITHVLPLVPGGNESHTDGEFDDEFDDPENSIDFADGVDADVLASRRRFKNAKTVPASTKSAPPRPSKALGTRRSTVEETRSVIESVDAPSKPSAGGAVKSALTRLFNRGGRDHDPYVVDLGIFGEGRPRLAPGVNGVVVPVVDDQLSTIIAYSLSSAEYAKQFKHFLKTESSAEDEIGPIENRKLSVDFDEALAAGGRLPFPRAPADTKAYAPFTESSPGQAPPQGNSEGQSIERRMLVRNKNHVKHTFRDFDEKGQVTCKFWCTTYWSTQFHAVRVAFLSEPSKSDDPESRSSSPGGLDVEQSYIESLSSAYAWAASGGKSGASFARTSDDRFVIKCISRTELQMFLDCAPAYFEYLSKAFFHGLPTVLCKIVGVYQIGVHNRVTGKRIMEQVAVMQNIFYNKKITKIFDLKGSLRGRFASQKEEAQPETPSANSSDRTPNHQRRRSAEGWSEDPSTGQGESLRLYGENNDSSTASVDSKDTEQGPTTLLDGDFLEFTLGRPLPLTDRAKAVFQMSILNDTLFLSIINVLDYSILVGVDEDSMELVVGIIDFMRQYDILKQMERVGKSLPMVVGSEAPTIIQPPLYKARFTNAMERYFMTVPSKWTTI